MDLLQTFNQFGISMDWHLLENLVLLCLNCLITMHIIGHPKTQFRSSVY